MEVKKKPVTKVRKWAPVVTAADLPPPADGLSKQEERLPSLDVSVVPLDWAAATTLKRSPSGSSGVFFVRIGNGMVVVKGSTNIAAEIFVAALGNLISVRVPKTRLVKWTDEEIGPLKETLLKLAGEISAGDTVKVQKEIDRPFLMLMEYMDGKDLETIDFEQCSSIFSTADGQPNERLRALGRLLALDIVCNNWDRLPLLWDNSGNLKNVIIHRAGDWEVVGIDQGFTPITHPDGLAKYTEKVSTYITKLVTKPDKEASETKSLRELLRGHSYYDFEVSGSLEIQNGLMEAVRTLAKMKLSDLEDLKQKVDSEIHEDPTGVWELSMKNIDPEFMYAIIQVFKTALENGAGK